MSRMSINLKSRTIAGHCCGMCMWWKPGPERCDWRGVPFARPTDGYDCSDFAQLEHVKFYEWRLKAFVGSATDGSVKE
jgi:hypothetical protein